VLASRLGPVDFTQALVAKGVETDLVGEHERLVDDDLVIEYRVRVEPRSSPTTAAETADLAD
jgi:hypothetical protein